MALGVPLQEDTPLFAGVVGGGERTPGSGFRAVLQGDRWTGSVDAGGVAGEGKKMCDSRWLAKLRKSCRGSSAS